MRLRLGHISRVDGTRRLGHVWEAQDTSEFEFKSESESHSDRDFKFDIVWHRLPSGSDNRSEP